MQLKETEIRIQIERDTTSKALVYTIADATKGTIARLPVDVVHLPTYFNDVERLFRPIDVPEDLQGHLLRPHLNEKEKNLVEELLSHGFLSTR